MPELSGVPDRVAVFAPAFDVRVTPVGSEPTVILKVEVGDAVAMTVNVPAVPTVNVTLFALVIAGAAVGPARRMVWFVKSAI